MLAEAGLEGKFNHSRKQQGLLGIISRRRSGMSHASLIKHASWQCLGVPNTRA